VLDPFAGTGTVPIEGERCGVESVGIEAHPFVGRIARAKLCWREDPRAFRRLAFSVLEEAERLTGDPSAYPPLIQKCYSAESLARLDALRTATERASDGSPLAELIWLALCSILRECSPVGTAQWQYVLPNKAKAKARDPYEAFLERVYLMADDMARRQRQPLGPPGLLYIADARDCAPVSDGWSDLVITSPPYVNNFDYADATRLEMTFFGEIRGWGDLQATVRRHLVRSCTQHVAPIQGQTEMLLADLLLHPIQAEITEVCERLRAERDGHGGRKPYHAMVAAYFADLARVWVALRRVTRPGALVCFVVGDSAPYGVHVPVERWLGELAVSAGFESYHFEQTRARNVKWKNRKHRVPLQEGYLWVSG
jgi:hypothetical protein